MNYGEKVIWIKGDSKPTIYKFSLFTGIMRGNKEDIYIIAEHRKGLLFEEFESDHFKQLLKVLDLEQKRIKWEKRDQNKYRIDIIE